MKLSFEIFQGTEETVRIYRGLDVYTPEEMPDEIVDFLVGLLGRWEARRVSE